MNISTRDLFQAMQMYQRIGYRMIDIPYVIDSDVSLFTIRDGKEVKDFKHLDKVYVASAEQGFLQLQRDGLLPTCGKFMALTPCYRTEETIDDTHFNIFLKLELLKIGGDVPTVLTDAEAVLRTLIITRRVETELGTDLYCGDIEVGSYGIAKFMDGTTYTYGTGYADPRMCICKEIRA